MNKKIIIFTFFNISLFFSIAHSNSEELHNYTNNIYVNNIQYLNDLRYSENYILQDFIDTEDPYYINEDFSEPVKEITTIKPYIINGSEITINDFPYYARLVIPLSSSKFFHSCGGTILNSKYILTAAHCVYNVNLNRYAILINSDSNVFSYKDYKYINSVHIHPLFDPTTFDSDIAIIELKDEITENFTPITIPNKQDVSRYNKSEKITIVGMGQNSTTKSTMSTKLEKSDIDFLSDEKCKSISEYKPNKIICSIDNGKGDICFGDSGGPATYYHDGKYKQIGITSLIIGNVLKCGVKGNFSLFTEINAFSDFIYNVTGISQEPIIESEIDTESKSAGSFGILSLFFLLSIKVKRKINN